MAIVITAPKEVYSIDNSLNASLFLAGGITNCPDWQSDVIDILKSKLGLTIYNPRRSDFPINDPHASEEQITWEYHHLRSADMILFWFSRGSLNPIVLYELGMWGNSRNKTIFVGCDPEYTRISDVRIQTALARPNLFIYDSLLKITAAISAHVNDTYVIRRN